MDDDFDTSVFRTPGGLAAHAPGEAHRMVRIRAGEWVGEMGLLSGRARGAHVRAVRDTALARLPRAAFERLAMEHPEVLLRVSQMLVTRLESQVRPAAPTPARSFALIPHSK